MPGAIVVEGHGEIEAAPNLVSRLATDLGVFLPWHKACRFKNLHLERGIRQAAEVHRARGNVDALLILRDEDDECPAEQAPRLASLLRGLDLPFPAAVVLLHREFEVLFLPCIDLMAGKMLTSCGIERPGVVPGTRFDGNPERIRGVKEWLSSRFPKGKSYKPTTDQLQLTRMINFDRLRASGLPCFGSLERGIRYLGSHIGRAGAVYPPE